MTQARPRRTLPDEWAGRGACPLCAARALQVVHRPKASDLVACTSCRSAYQVEEGGNRIRLETIAPQYEYLIRPARGRWITVAELRQMASEAAATSEVEQEPEPESSPRSTGAGSGLAAALHAIVGEQGGEAERAVSKTQQAAKATVSHEQRARGLFELGHTPAQIRRVLVKAGATEAEIDQALQALTPQLEEKTSSVRTVAILGITLLGVFLISVFGLASYYRRTLPAVPTETVAPTAAPGQPSAPGGAQPTTAPQSPGIDLPVEIPEILSPPEPVVETGSGPPATSCPSTPGRAAELFGGEAGNWQRSDVGGWVYIGIGHTITVELPDGMTAGYPVDRGEGSLEFVSVSGPATLRNIAYIAILCS